MKEAWQRAEKLIGSDLKDMQRDLRQEFLDGHLIAAVRLFAPEVVRGFAPDGRELEQIIYTEATRIILERECWQWLKINYAWSITGWELIPKWKTIPGSEGEQRVVVRRRELDKYYPSAEHRADDRRRTRRKPRPKPTRAPRTEEEPKSESPPSEPPPPPQQAAAEEIQEKPPGVSTKAWVTRKAQRLKRDGEIPDAINKTAFARALAGKSVSWRYVRNHLEEWSLWPISAIK